MVLSSVIFILCIIRKINQIKDQNPKIILHSGQAYPKFKLLLLCCVLCICFSLSSLLSIFLLSNVNQPHHSPPHPQKKQDAAFEKSTKTDIMFHLMSKCICHGSLTLSRSLLPLQQLGLNFLNRSYTVTPSFLHHSQK